jgi:integrase
VPMFPGDLPRQDHPLPKALDDASAAKLLRAAQADRRMLVRVTVEMLLRTGLRVSEYTSLTAGAVVLIGAGPWLHVPVGKLGEDRYLPLHPQLAALIDAYRAAHVPASHPLLRPRRLRVDLRNLLLLPHQHRVPAHPRRPGRPRRHPRPHHPPGAVRPAHQPDRQHPGIMISLTTITRIMPMIACSWPCLGLPAWRSSRPPARTPISQWAHTF